MTLHVRKLGGPFFDLEVDAVTTVGQLRGLIETATGKTMEGQRMAFESRQLDQDERLLISYGVTEGSRVVVYGS